MTKFVNDDRTVSVALCAGRHAMPEGVVGSVFPETLNPTDVDGMKAVAEAFILANDDKAINLVVTGLTVAAMAVVKAALDMIHASKVYVSLTLWHYDRDTGDYYSQEMLRFPDVCPHCGHVSYGEYFCSHCQC